jgi:putative phage-type endonuclease
VADLIPTASEGEWLAARRKGVTASEIAVLMGLSPYSSPYALYHQKLGILQADEDQAVFERGRVLEPYVAEKFAAAHPEFSVEGDGRALYAHRERPWQLATPDRLVRARGKRPMDYLCCELHKPGKALPGAMAPCCDPNDCGPCCEDCSTCPTNNRLWPRAVLETKTDAGSDEWGEEGTDEIPVHYRAQVLWQMDVMGVARAHVSCLRVHDWKIREYVIEHDPDVPLGYDVTHALDATGKLCDLCTDILAMRVAATGFLVRIDRQDPPDVDWRPATAYALKQLHPSLEDRDAHIGRQLEISYRAALRRFKEAEQRKDEMTNRLREAMGSANRAVAAGTHGPDGKRVVIATRQVYDLPAKTIERKASTVDKLVPVKPKRES